VLYEVFRALAQHNVRDPQNAIIARTASPGLCNQVKVEKQSRLHDALANSSKTQAHQFLRAVLGDRLPGEKETVVMIDFEPWDLYDRRGKLVEKVPAIRLRDACAIMEEVHSITKVWPGLYVSRSYVEEVIDREVSHEVSIHPEENRAKMKERIWNRVVFSPLIDPNNRPDIKRDLASSWLMVAGYESDVPKLPQAAS
jgi:hypothetical protein